MSTIARADEKLKSKLNLIISQNMTTSNQFSKTNGTAVRLKYTAANAFVLPPSKGEVAELKQKKQNKNIIVIKHKNSQRANMATVMATREGAVKTARPDSLMIITPDREIVQKTFELHTERGWG